MSNFSRSNKEKDRVAFRLHPPGERESPWEQQVVADWNRNAAESWRREREIKERAVASFAERRR
jgi:hypothetical protein